MSIADTALLGRVGNSTPTVPVTAGLVLQLDANAITGISDGTGISTWSDTSGSGNHFANSTGNSATYPVYRTNQQNGRPAVDFDGSNDFLTTVVVIDTSTVYSMFLAFKLDSAAGTQGLFRNGDGVGYGLLCSGGSREILHRAVAALDDGACTTNAEYWSAVRTSAPLAKLWVNGVNQAITNSTSACNAPASNGWVGVFNTGLGFYMDGKIFEVLCYNTNLSDADRGLVEAYLALKWGI